MEAAHKIAERSNCIRRSVGAVIVLAGDVISTGWNGVSSHFRSCREAGCPRCIAGGETGTGYESCICIHAEQMAIGDAAARGVATKGATLYVNLRPCLQCLAIIRTAGIREVFFDEDWVYATQFERVYQQFVAGFDCFRQLRRDDDTRQARRIA